MIQKTQNINICNVSCKIIRNVRRPAYTTGAFTLVELIVVITILAILWTIAFISLQWYSAQARDSKRLSDISNIKKSLELFSLNTWKYPEPDNNFTVSYSWEILRYQWTVWDQVSTNLSRNLNEKPTDPLTESEYTYSTTHNQTEYEVLGLYESDILWTNVETPLVGVLQSNAATQDYPKIDWNYNWIYIKIANYYIPTPSIINAEILSNDDLDSDNIKSQIISWWDNLPLTSTGRLNVNLSVYTWTITSESTDIEKSNLVQVIQTAYSWSDLASDTMYADILSRTSTWEMVDFVDIVVLGRANYSSISWDVSNILYSSCQEILNNDSNSSDWIYTIDPEKNWTWFEVYCDMTTDDWGWTLVLAYNGRTNPAVTFNWNDIYPTLDTQGYINTSLIEVEQFRITAWHETQNKLISRIHNSTDWEELIIDMQDKSNDSYYLYNTEYISKSIIWEWNECDYRNAWWGIRFNYQNMWLLDHISTQTHWSLFVWLYNNMFCDQELAVKSYPAQYIRLWFK